MATSFEYVVGRIAGLQKVEEIDTEELGSSVPDDTSAAPSAEEVPAE